MGELYRARGASRVYRMGEVLVEALKPTDLDVIEGETLAILGPSGSGKSTLLHLLGGVDRLSAGTVRFRDLELTELDTKGLTLFRRRHVGFVFQFYNLLPSLTAIENVAMATEVAVDPREPRAMIELVGLGERADHFPSQLSGGEQQRVGTGLRDGRRREVLNGLTEGETVVLHPESIDDGTRVEPLPGAPPE